MMKAGILPIIFMTLLLFGCSGEETVTQRQDEAAPTATQDKVTISPDNATARSIFTLNAGASLLSSASIQWYVNGNIAETSGAPRFSSSTLTKGDVVHAVVTKKNKTYRSNRIRIKNTPPRIRRAEMVPALPRSGATIRIETEAYDVDGDKIYYKYKWRLNGEYISDQTYLDTDLKRDDMIVLELTPYDSDDKGSTIFVKNKVYNSLPVVTGNEPVFDGNTYSYSLSAVDPDGDELTYEIKDGPAGMTVDRYGNITWKAGPEDAGTHRYTVIVNDNHGGELIVPVTTTIRFESKERS